MSLGKPVTVFQNMDEEMHKFAIECAHENLAVQFHEQVILISFLTQECRKSQLC